MSIENLILVYRLLNEEVERTERIYEGIRDILRKVDNQSAEYASLWAEKKKAADDYYSAKDALDNFRNRAWA